ncbi:MAG: protein-export chaperone SecB [Alphaproteobacteria bacterium]|nr:protein-export chaperone SecB [Alphaproteobacteria bacterium]
MNKKLPYTIAQTFVKDVSFENPLYVDLLVQAQKHKPEVNFNLEIKIHQAGEDRFEVAIIVKVNVTFDKKSYVRSEITYAALVMLADTDKQEHILFVDVPHQIYPDLRPLVSQLFLAAGAASSFKLPIVDFASLYERRLAEKAKESAKEEKNTVN